jgi:hypothetical protein
MDYGAGETIKNHIETLEQAGLKPAAMKEGVELCVMS